MKVKNEKIKRFITENKEKLHKMIYDEIILTDFYIEIRQKFNEEDLMKIVKELGVSSLTNKNNLFVAVMATDLKDIYINHYLFNLKVVGKQKLENKISLYFLEKKDENKIAAIYYDNYYSESPYIERYFLIEN